MAKSGEFAWIDRIAAGFSGITAPGFGRMEGIGDDAAVIPIGDGMSLVATTDMLIEGVHFLRRAAEPETLGWKSLAVNLSDVAAMGAHPVGSMLSIALPPDCRGAWAERFMEGYRALSGLYDVPLIGGDTTSGDAITINVVALGHVSDEQIKRRSGARHGDVIAVTGLLGDSAAGLRDVLSGRFDTDAARIHHHPEPCVHEGIFLGERTCVHAMIDLSDGLASDLVHVMERSGVGAEIELRAIPTRQPIELAVTGGEDYQLLFTVAADSWDELQAQYRREFGQKLFAIGRITERACRMADQANESGASARTGDATPTEQTESTDTLDKIVWLQDGNPVAHDWHGFSHF